MTVSIDEIAVADPADAWTAAGFAVEDGLCRIGGVRIRLVGRERDTGIVGWSLRGIAADAPLDGIPTTSSDAAAPAPAAHPNGATAIDHIVLLSPDLGRTVAALAAIGVQPRRERDGLLAGRPMRQIFFRFGEVIIEAVGPPEATGEGPSTLWGLTYTVADIDATALFFGERTTPVKDAVQPGRRITTVRHQEFGISVRTAMISAPIPRSPRPDPTDPILSA